MSSKQDDDESDVEIEGMELDNEDCQENDQSQDSDGDDVANLNNNNDEYEDDETQLTNAAQDDVRDYEETQKERMELMAAGGDEDGAATPSSDSNVVPEKRLQYLLDQSEMFHHFLAGSVAAKKKREGGGGGKGGRASKRLTEAEEDSQMLKAAQSKRRGIVRVEEQPKNLSGQCKMHPYQLEGLNWMIKLHDHGINGILADEMGLGKTLQTISMLAYLREARGVKGPHLIVVPKSCVGNWIKEFKKWCPSIRAIKMLFVKEERKKLLEEWLPLDKSGKRRFDAMVCSYEGLLKEKSKLAKIAWEYLVIDEAHRIKNEHSSLSKVVRTMSTRYRILITGTPLQNNLHELWALLNFLLPDIFGDVAQFDKWFSLEDESGQDNVIRKLHTVLRPFMLRRVKKDVACSLPPKKETKLHIGLQPMQQEWYKRVLRKEAHELNALGGPSRVRLLNILMQLRKVCNHPYLFDGAEPGPPFSDGPHLWENSGKMMLLNKLLPKLKKNGSRVLIFCQMTRVLDILEDYLRYVKYEYCRIDGNTPGESRDNQMEEFNAPNSSKFCFILSTRAGGLGINLATADIVILYDSDWNPQVDLQAMDRAHRIGQTKPVQVFRLVTEGTVEEKIIERADRKLFLDAAVIQQGRLAEQCSAVDRDSLMHMVRFGADQILSGKGGAYTDEDIDALIAKGEERTSQMQAKLSTDAKHNLADFSLLDNDEKDTFSFGGKNYRGEGSNDTGNFINLPQRERKRNYDVNEYYREALSTGSSTGMRAHLADAAKKRMKKGPNMQDFQLYNRTRLEEIYKKEQELLREKDKQLNIIMELRLKAKHAPSINNTRATLAKGESSEEILKNAEELEKQLSDFDLPAPLQKEKDDLIKEAFPDWTKKDFRVFVASLEKYGRFDVKNVTEHVAEECGKDETDVKRYFVAFWTNYRNINDWKKIIDRVERGEKKINRLKEVKDAIADKIDDHLRENFGLLPWDIDGDEPATTTNQQPKTKIRSRLPQDASSIDLIKICWHTMKFNYGSYKTHSYTEEEDAFLVYMMHKHGYGESDRIKMEIKRATHFRFDWFFKSRSEQEIQKRCDTLVKIVEKENDEIIRKEQEEARRRALNT